MINTNHAFNILKEENVNMEHYTYSTIHQDYVIDFLNEGLELLYQSEDIHFPEKFDIDVSFLENIFNQIAKIMSVIDIKTHNMVRYDENLINKSINNIENSMQISLKKLLLKSFDLSDRDNQEYHRDVVGTLHNLYDDINKFTDNIQLINQRKYDEVNGG